MSRWTEIPVGVCKTCDGNRVLYTDFGGEQKTVACPECRGSGVDQ